MFFKSNTLVKFLYGHHHPGHQTELGYKKKSTKTSKIYKTQTHLLQLTNVLQIWNKIFLEASFWCWLNSFVTRQLHNITNSHWWMKVFSTDSILHVFMLRGNLPCLTWWICKTIIHAIRHSNDHAEDHVMYSPCQRLKQCKLKRTRQSTHT